MRVFVHMSKCARVRPSVHRGEHVCVVGTCICTVLKNKSTLDVPWIKRLKLQVENGPG